MLSHAPGCSKQEPGVCSQPKHEAAFWWRRKRPVTSQLTDLRSTLHELYCNNWKDTVACVPKLRTYIMYKNEYITEPYVECVISRAHRSALAKFRCGILPLSVETVGSMPSVWNFAFVYIVMIISSKMNTTSFSHVTCIMTCDLHCLITSDRMFPILTHWTLMIKWYIWCHAMRLKKTAEFVFRAMEMRHSVLYKKD